MNGEAVVVKNAGSHYLLSCLPEWAPFPAVLKGKIRLKANESTNPVAVGDRVLFESDALTASEVSLEHPALICSVMDRKNHIIRKSTNLSRQSHVIAANVDMAFAVVSLYFPEVKLPFLDRMLVTCEVYGVPVTIVLNKVDLYREETPETVANFIKIYTEAGYRVIQTSARTGEGIAEVSEACRDRVCLFSGESGVGKSSLIKALDPSLEPKIGKISTAHLQGKHTTSLYEMYRIADCGYVIDTPGLRGFGLVNLEKDEIARYFPEMLKASEKCRFTPCTHTHEPGCAVKEAVEEGLISPERYSSYLGMIEEDRKFR